MIDSSRGAAEREPPNSSPALLLLLQDRGACGTRTASQLARLRSVRGNERANEVEGSALDRDRERRVFSPPLGAFIEFGFSTSRLP